MRYEFVNEKGEKLYSKLNGVVFSTFSQDHVDLLPKSVKDYLEKNGFKKVEVRIEE